VGQLLLLSLLLLLLLYNFYDKHVKVKCKVFSQKINNKLNYDIIILCYLSIIICHSHVNTVFTSWRKSLFHGTQWKCTTHAPTTPGTPSLILIYYITITHRVVRVSAFELRAVVSLPFEANRNITMYCVVHWHHPHAVSATKLQCYRAYLQSLTSETALCLVTDM